MSPLFNPNLDAQGYRLLLSGKGRVTTSGAISTNYSLSNTADNLFASNPNAAASLTFPTRNYVGANFDVPGKTQKLMVDICADTSSTSPAVTLTLGFYAFTISTTYVIGAAAMTVALNVTGANSSPYAASAEITKPADARYGLGYILSGTPLGNFTFDANVWVKNV